MTTTSSSMISSSSDNDDNDNNTSPMFGLRSLNANDIGWGESPLMKKNPSTTTRSDDEPVSSSSSSDTEDDDEDEEDIKSIKSYASSSVPPSPTTTTTEIMNNDSTSSENDDEEEDEKDKQIKNSDEESTNPFWVLSSDKTKKNKKSTKEKKKEQQQNNKRENTSADASEVTNNFLGKDSSLKRKRDKKQSPQTNNKTMKRNGKTRDDTVKSSVAVSDKSSINNDNIMTKNTISGKIAVKDNVRQEGNTIDKSTVAKVAEELDQEEEPYYKVESMNDSGTKVKLTLYKKNDRVSIVGSAYVQCIKGTVEILGYTLNGNSDSIENEDENKVGSVEIHSPNWMSTLTIENKNPCGNINKDNEDSFSSSSSSTVIIKSTLEEECSFEIIPINDKNKTTTTTMTDSSNTKILPITIPSSWKTTADYICKQYRSKEGNNDSEEEMRILICGAKHVGKSSSLRYVINRLLSCQEEKHFHQIMNNNKKKSNNTKKNNFVGVSVLDCDVGQPEFTPPGIASLTLVPKPILSPPCVHMSMTSPLSSPSSFPSGIKKLKTKPSNVQDNNIYEKKYQCLSSFFFGDVLSKSDPLRYLNILGHLKSSYDEYNNNHRHNKLPLVVNTDGWVKGLGNEILGNIIQLVNPTHIIQIMGSTRTKMFYLPQLVPPASTPDDQQQEQEYSDHGAQIFTVESYSLNNNNKQITSNKNLTNYSKIQSTSADLRCLKLCCYFLPGGYSSVFEHHHLRKNNMNNYRSNINTSVFFQTQAGIIDRYGVIAKKISEMKPYVVSIDNIEICLEESDSGDVGIRDYINSQEYDTLSLDCLNGSVVGLLCRNVSSESSSQISVEIPQCLGLGIVRSIDTRQRLLFILSPLSLEEIQQTNLIHAGGKILLPDEMIAQGLIQTQQYLHHYEQLEDNRTTPYIDCDYFSNGSCSLPYLNCDGLLSGIVGFFPQNSSSSPSYQSPRQQLNKR